MQKTPLKIGARSSNLALTMALEVKNSIERICNIDSSLINIAAMSTKGDRELNQSLTNLGGKGLFTQEIENALLNYNIDMAVHSTKDMPSILPDKLQLAAYLKRAAIEDCFISYDNTPFLQLPIGAIIGTASLRRQALVKKYRPDLNIVLLRGNVETRMEKLKSGVIDGTFLALCGLQRLHLEHMITQIMDINFFPPAPAQGCICVETRAGDVEMLALAKQLNDSATCIEVSAEREFLKILDGNCRTPICAYARFKLDELIFYGLVLAPDGTKSYEYKTNIHIEQNIPIEAKIIQAEKIGKIAAINIKEQMAVL